MAKKEEETTKTQSMMTLTSASALAETLTEFSDTNEEC